MYYLRVAAAAGQVERGAAVRVLAVDPSVFSLTSHLMVCSCPHKLAAMTAVRSCASGLRQLIWHE